MFLPNKKLFLTFYFKSYFSVSNDKVSVAQKVFLTIYIQNNVKQNESYAEEKFFLHFAKNSKDNIRREFVNCPPNEGICSIGNSNI
jgi:hypothetical protein